MKLRDLDIQIGGGGGGGEVKIRKEKVTRELTWLPGSILQDSSASLGFE